MVSEPQFALQMFPGPVGRFLFNKLCVVDVALQQNAVLRCHTIHVLHLGELFKIFLCPTNTGILVSARLTWLPCYWIFLEREGIRRQLQRCLYSCSPPTPTTRLRETPDRILVRAQQERRQAGKPREATFGLGFVELPSLLGRGHCRAAGEHYGGVEHRRHCAEDIDHPCRCHEHVRRNLNWRFSESYV